MALRANSSHYISLLLMLLAVAVLGVSLGATTIPIKSVAEAIQVILLPDQPSANQTVQLIIEQIRLPRVVMALLVGALLALSGVCIQGLFRNPLAEPSILGVSAGATLVAMVTLIALPQLMALAQQSLGEFALPLAAFIGALLSTLLVLTIQGRDNPDSTRLILSGVAVNIMAGAGISLCAYLASAEQLRLLTFWGLGSLAQAEWNKVALLAIVLLICWPLLWRLYRPLNALLLGESEARHLGYNVRHLKLQVIVLVALAVGSAVAFCGIIGFIGLVVPHIIRLIFGPNHNHLIPLSVLTGALVLVLADLLARVVIAPAELPVGIVTAVIGGPFFMWLLTRFKGSGL